MTCYHHQDAQAVAHCSFCSKHLCKDCLKTQSNRIVCEDLNCSKEVDVYDQIVKCSARIYNLTGEKKRVIPWVGLAFVLFGLAFSFYNYYIAYTPDFLLTTFSIMILVMGGLMIRQTRKLGMDL